jgi:hypothetical protein
MLKDLFRADNGDTLIVAVDRFGNVVDREDRYSTYRLDIISKTNVGWVVYVPSYIAVPHAKKLNEALARKFEIDKKYLGGRMIVVGIDSVHDVIIRTDGTTCIACKKFYPYAEPNQDDKTLICYSCRDNPYRFSVKKD